MTQKHRLVLSRFSKVISKYSFGKKKDRNLVQTSEVSVFVREKTSYVSAHLGAYLKDILRRGLCRLLSLVDLFTIIPHITAELFICFH